MTRKTKQVIKPKKNTLSYSSTHKRLYVAWINIRHRCNSPKNGYYKDYGAKGITVCEEWQSSHAFCQWAIKNGYSDEKVLDRNDRQKGYSPENCFWVLPQDRRSNYGYSCWVKKYPELFRLWKRLTCLADPLCCNEWKDPNIFCAYAFSSGYKKGFRLFRKDKKKGYFPSNCFFGPPPEGLCRKYPNIYRIWNGILVKCENPLHRDFSRYGARGIKVCKPWHNLSAFISWSFAHGYEEGMVFIRKNRDRGYFPSNCAWVCREDCPSPKGSLVYLTVGESKKRMKAWADLSGIPYDVISRLVRLGRVNDAIAKIETALNQLKEI